MFSAAHLSRFRGGTSAGLLANLPNSFHTYLAHLKRASSAGLLTK